MGLLAWGPLSWATTARADPNSAPARTAAADSFRLTGAQMRLDTSRNVATFTDSVRLDYGTATVQSRRAERSGSSGQERVQFWEDVRIHDRGIDMSGDEGEFVRNENYAELRGRVVIRDSTGTIHARRARYYRGPRHIRLWGQVDFQDKTTRVQADSVFYREVEGMGEGFGNVVITDVESGSQARGPHGFYDRKHGEAWLDPQPVLQLHEKSGQRAFVYAKELRMHPETKQVRARGEVRIERGLTVATGDSAILYRDRDHLELRGSPEVRRGSSRITGRDIDVDFGTEDIEQVRVRRQARLVQARADTLLIREPNVVEGDSAVLYFASGSLHRAVVSGRGSSKYVPANERPGRISLNEATADSIVMQFAGDEVEEVIFVGNAAGTYRFHDGPVDTTRALRRAVVDTVFGVVETDTTGFNFRRDAEVVQYSAERILYLAPANDLHLQGSSEVDYQGQTLRAGDITYDADTDQLTAKDNPIFLQGGDRIYGTEMGYDMDRRRARVVNGATQYDQGYYTGQRIVRLPDGTLEVAHGTYTSCDLAHPHYTFRSKQMKIYLNDMVVGRPVWLYFGNLPTLYLPFYFNSVNPGRRSGFLQPDIEVGLGTDSRYIRGLDYYWAASDYWDVLFTTAYNERPRVDTTDFGTVLRTGSSTRNIQLAANMRYKVRYHVDGNIDYRVSQDIDTHASHVTMRGEHRQTLGSRMSLNGTLAYASDDVAQRITHENQNYSLAQKRDLNSSLTFTRNSDLLRTTLSLQRHQILSPDSTSLNQSVLGTTAPQLQLTFRSIRLAPRPRDPRSAPWWQRVLSDLQFSPNLQLQHRSDDVFRQRFVNTQTGEVIPDTTAVPDSLIRRETFTETLRRVTGSTSASLSRQSRLAFLSVTPSVSWAASYVDASQIPNAIEDQWKQSLNGGVQASTAFYGIFAPRIGRLQAFRHTIRPTASWNYTAPISGAQASQSLSLNLVNQLDIKYDKEGKPGHLDGLLAWSLSTNYNPDRARRWSNIGSGLTINRQGPLTLNITQTYDPYAGKILSTTIPFAFRMSGSFPDWSEAKEEEKVNSIVAEEGKPPAEDSLGVAKQPEFRPRVESGLDTAPEIRREGGGPLQWDFGFSYSLTRALGQTQHANVAVSAGIRPTRNWKIGYSAVFDTRERKMILPNIHIERDLHCMRASFSRIFSGYDNEWRYYFRIHIIRYQDDLFLESGDRSYYGGY